MKSVCATAICLGVAMFASACSHSHEIDNKQTIAKTAVPANVMSAFQKAHPAAQISKVEEIRYRDGKTHYEFKYWENGKKHTVEYDKKGEKVEKAE